MTITLPHELTEPLSWIGFIWPEADEDKLYEDGQAWLDYGSNCGRTLKRRTRPPGRCGATTTASRSTRSNSGGPAKAPVIIWTKQRPRSS